MDTLAFLISKLAALLLRAETWEALLLAGALIARPAEHATKIDKY
ncbi:hypothetical protein [Thioclava sp. L04-15]|nr:hypothetical protein [Thioclava sp. L04-15]